MLLQKVSEWKISFSITLNIGFHNSYAFIHKPQDQLSHFSTASHPPTHLHTHAHTHTHTHVRPSYSWWCYSECGARGARLLALPGGPDQFLCKCMHVHVVCIRLQSAWPMFTCVHVAGGPANNQVTCDTCNTTIQETTSHLPAEANNVLNCTYSMPMILLYSLLMVYKFLKLLVQVEQW